MGRYRPVGHCYLSCYPAGACVLALWACSIIALLGLLLPCGLLAILWLVALVRTSVFSWLAVVTLRMIALITVVAALVVWLAFVLLRLPLSILRTVLVILRLVIALLLTRSLVFIVLLLFLSLVKAAQIGFGKQVDWLGCRLQPYRLPADSMASRPDGSFR